MSAEVVDDYLSEVAEPGRSTLQTRARCTSRSTLRFPTRSCGSCSKPGWARSSGAAAEPLVLDRTRAASLLQPPTDYPFRVDADQRRRHCDRLSAPADLDRP